MQRYRRSTPEGAGFPRPEGMPAILHELLVSRGIRSAEEAARFLEPTVEDIRDPFLLKDMDRAAAEVHAALEAGDRICIYGDYDVDGVTATSILLDCLTAHGADVFPYIPKRHTEGYGMNAAAVRTIAEKGARLIVTVDCGISNREELALARELGLRTVVTDHHTPPELLPDCPVVDPHLGDYPTKGLCGGALAFKLVWALYGREEALRYIDLAALATVADVIPLRDEARAIVRLGTRALSEALVRPGIEALKHEAGFRPGSEVRASDIAFRLGPRLNSAGRMGDAMRGVRLLTARTIDEAMTIGEELEQENDRRKQTEQRVRREAEEQLSELGLAGSRAIILLGTGWEAGVIGLVAGKLCEKYHMPTIVMTDDGERITGSCRSIEGVDIHRALTACADLFERFGGHKQAAGLTLKRGCLEQLRSRLDAWLKQNIEDSVYIPEECYDLELPLRALSCELVEKLGALEPTGEGNSLPIFRAHVRILEEHTLSEGKHLKLKLGDGAAALDTLMWFSGELAGRLPEHMDVLFKPEINEFRGSRNVQLQLQAWRPESALTTLSAKLNCESGLLQSFLTEVFYNKESSLEADRLPEGGEVTVEALARRLTTGVFGTLVLVGELETARSLLEAVEAAAEGKDEACMPDVVFGTELPDRRGFDTIWVLPMGRVPDTFTTVVTAALPFRPRTGENVRTERLAGADMPAWVRCIPDIDGLREVYKACRRIADRRFSGADAILSALAADSGVDARGCAAALVALEELGLIERSYSAAGTPIGVAAVKGKKADPSAGRVWQQLQRRRELETEVEGCRRRPETEP